MISHTGGRVVSDEFNLRGGADIAGLQSNGRKIILKVQLQSWLRNLKGLKRLGRLQCGIQHERSDL